MNTSLNFCKPPRSLGSFHNKKVVVTGASSGLGREIAQFYLSKGAKVALVGRKLDALCELGKNYKK